MKTTMTLTSNLNCTVFDIFNQDVDEVILIINFYLLLGEEENEQPTIKKAPTRTAAKKEERIRVTDATATGGWF